MKKVLRKVVLNLDMVISTVGLENGLGREAGFDGVTILMTETHDLDLESKVSDSVSYSPDSTVTRP